MYPLVIMLSVFNMMAADH